VVTNYYIMKKYLLSILLLISAGLTAQNNATTCAEANSLCGALGEPFINTIDASPAFPNYDSFGCLGSEPNPYFFYLPVSQSGELFFLIEQHNLSGALIDVDFACMGPFTDLTEACEIQDGSLIVGCSFSASATEYLHIPNAQVGEYYLLMVTNFSNQPGYITILPGDGSTGAIDCSGINLNAFLDSNANGTQDTGEMGFPAGSFIYEATGSGNPHVVTSSDGGYTIYDENLTNTYDVSFAVAPEVTAFYSVATPSYSSVPVASGSAIATYNFPVTITQAYEDVAVYVIPTSPPIPGFNYTNVLVYSNIGNQPIVSGTVSFIKDPLSNIVSVSDPAAVTTTTGFDISFTNLQPFETHMVTVTMDVPVIPTVNLDDTLATSATITPLANDLTPDNNASSNVQIVVGSYDPNDKMESRGRYIPINEFSNEDYLYYTVRFQNTGTAPAFNVRIEDLLDSQLDPESIQMIRASHDFTLEKTGNQLVWKFDDIMLPQDEADEPGSHGFVYFRVKPMPGFAVGDIIPNTADIYFDFNPAIVTNTFTTEFVSQLGTPEFAPAGFVMYPNPANSSVTLTMQDNGENIKSVKVYDITGKVIFNRTDLAANTMTLDVTPFGVGAYFVELVNNLNIKVVKKLLVK